MENQENSTLPPSPVERAENAARRMEEANKRAEELLKRNEELYSRLVMSGHTQAGNTVTQQSVESPKDYAKRIMSGKI